MRTLSRSLLVFSFACSGDPPPVETTPPPPPPSECEAACARAGECSVGPFTEEATCIPACEARDDSPETLATWTCLMNAGDCAAARACEGPAEPAVDPAVEACRTACARAIECNAGGFASAEECQSACASGGSSPAATEWPRVRACIGGAADCDAARACQMEVFVGFPAPDQPTAGRYDVRSLVPPITINVFSRLIAPETDAVGSGRYALVVELTDSAGTVRAVQIGEWAQPQQHSMLAIPPATEENMLYTFETFFAGARDEFQLQRSGNRIDVRERESDEESRNSRWRVRLRIDLPPGAELNRAVDPPQ